jgi:hypothetical protein
MRGSTMIKRKPLSPEALAAFHAVMQRFCEDVERRKADEQAERLAEEVGRLADEMGANV